MEERMGHKQKCVNIKFTQISLNLRKYTFIVNGACKFLEKFHLKKKPFTIHFKKSFKIHSKNSYRKHFKTILDFRFQFAFHFTFKMC